MKKEALNDAIRRLYGTTPNRELAARLNITVATLEGRAKRMQLRFSEPKVPVVSMTPKESKQLTKVKDQLNKVLRQKEETKNKTLEYVAALQSAVFQAVEEIQIEPPKARRLDQNTKAWRESTEEICVVMASDWQLGKVTPTYNSDVCEKRIKTLGETVVRLAQIQNTEHPVRKCHLQLIGDIVEGEGIFPSQAHLIDSGLYRQVGVNGPRILCQLILDLLTFFETVHVTGVIGNHGQVRLGMGDSNPETNMDRLLYQIVRLMLRNEPRVTWNIPEGHGERNWFAVDRVFDWGFLLAHGDQIRGGFGGFPFYGSAKKAWGWIDSIDEPWDFLNIAHWHTPTMQTLNRREMRCNGSTESSNTYAQEQLAAIGHPTQWCAFVHPRRGITAEYWVKLEQKIPNSKRFK